ncbi:hypothetical protein E2562_014296 [Oryza meyeriana var. granulata]|uniref:Uncharacterized protein n=1 Tax=Oryza meyeriana var. granulata TaxID=110450 RepID=A0A6G1C6R2_9ORYZ|nr:hypothetical protein E2562_014296 [Oryza meyeriana var. granulata]
MKLGQGHSDASVLSGFDRTGCVRDREKRNGTGRTTSAWERASARIQVQLNLKSFCLCCWWKATGGSSGKRKRRCLGWSGGAGRAKRTNEEKTDELLLSTHLR